MAVGEASLSTAGRRSLRSGRDARLVAGDDTLDDRQRADPKTELSAARDETEWEDDVANASVPFRRLAREDVARSSRHVRSIVVVGRPSTLPTIRWP